MHVVVAKVLKMPEADKAGCRAGNDCGGLDLLAHHFCVGASQAQRPRGRYAQAVHRL